MVFADETTVRKVDVLLTNAYGDKRWRKRVEPLDKLILTILSQHTNDTNSDKAFVELKRRFPKWEQVLQAPVSAITSAIKSAGLANQKAPRIKAILKQIAQHNSGKLALNFLAKMPVAEGLSWLRNLPGVGPKTAACVLLFGFGKPVFPVDTHIHRIAKRLGWIDAKVSEAKANELLNAVIPYEIKYRLHLNLIAHGRATCKAQNPRCDACIIKHLCAYYRRGGGKMGKGKVLPHESYDREPVTKGGASLLS